MISYLLAATTTESTTAPANWPDTISRWLFTALVTAAGSAITWVVTWRKSLKDIAKVQAEVDKLKLEAITEAGKILEKRQAARKSYRDACTKLTTKLDQLDKELR